MYISINNNKFNCKVVSTPEKIRLGMMGQSFSNFDGMLFVSPEDTTQSFWMKNCVVPLDIVFIKKNIINDISPNCPPCDTEECETYEGDGGFVLELPANTCRSLGIKIGDRVDYQ
jgi:uncharacterized membrane protein (UPF0127 family)